MGAPSNTFLCLNGHTITGAAGNSTIAVGSGVNFILTDCKGSGKITHGSSDAVGCGVNAVGSFTMYGGNITGNHNSDGGGVYVSAQDGTQGRFAMYGGSITGNNASSFGSGGVCVYGTMTVSGSVRITDNVNGGSKGDNGIYTGGTASNVRLVGRTTITIDGPLTEGSQIGVSLYSNRIFTSGWSKNMSGKEVSSYFTADDSSSTVTLENNELKLSNPHTHMIMRCWPLRRHKLHILRFRAERESSSIPLRLLSKSQSRCWIAILCFLRTSAQRWLLPLRRTPTRCRGRKPHTAATRASRRRTVPAVEGCKDANRSRCYPLTLLLRQAPEPLVGAALRKNAEISLCDFQRPL